MEGMHQPNQVRHPQNNSHQDNAGYHGPRSHEPQPPQSSKKWYQPTMESKVALILSIIAAVLVVGALMVQAFSDGRSGAANFVKDDQYQAVFLSNGQVYFGQITGMNSDLLVLEDIFYLQVDQQLQPDETETTGDPQVSLAKLGNELHGPEDQMFISMSDVIFWENLREDGDVVQAISQYNAGNGEGADLEGTEEDMPPALEEEQTTEQPVEEPEEFPEEFESDEE